MGRKILFITTDQQRYDALGCNGNTIARTPVVDRLAAEGVNYRRAYNQNTVCMPARSTMLTGQYPRTHGVVANGVPLPADAPSIAAWLAERAGYRTALLGKAHFEPAIDFHNRYEENARAVRGDIGAWRGFERAMGAFHAAAAGNFTPGETPSYTLLSHYGHWLADHHPEYLDAYGSILGGEAGGDTGAPETKKNRIPREWYHTDWVADMTISWLESLAPEDDWFCWMSFPDPHHPWDPPESELYRVPWKDLDLPPGHPGSDEAIRAVLSEKPAHWLAFYEGRFVNQEGGAGRLVPAALSHDQLREINAKVHVMNELVDEACGRVLRRVGELGWADETDVVYTTDHGELQGDYGFIFKGPFHTDSLMRVPLLWRPAPVAGVAPAVVEEPVGHVDLVATFCEIAGVERPEWAEGAPLPTASGSGRERVLCEWDSQFPGYGMHLRSIYRDGWLCTAYEASTDGQPNGLEREWGDFAMRPCGIHYDGTEGELYKLDEDPHQWHNRWDDPACKAIRADLVADLYDSLPEARETPLLVEAPA
jgi:arylsulfatase A-like enzyme